MSECGCHHNAASLSRNTDHARRRVLWIVLAINLLLFAGEFGAGWWADSSALQADSLDSLGDALVYGLSLAVVGGTLRQRSKAVFFKGGLQALFGLAVLVEVGRRAWFGAEPLAPIMAIAATVALLGNLICFALLTRFRSDDMNMRSVWLCSRNDLVNNVGVIAVAGAVAWLDAAWPDLVVGALVALLFLRTAAHVLSGAWKDWRQGDVSAVPESPPTACRSQRGAGPMTGPTP